MVCIKREHKSLLCFEISQLSCYLHPLSHPPTHPHLETTHNGDFDRRTHLRECPNPHGHGDEICCRHLWLNSRLHRVWQGIYPCGKLDPISVPSYGGALLTLQQDTDGKEIIDFICMLSATNLGHCHPKMVQAMTESINKGKNLRAMRLLSEY